MRNKNPFEIDTSLTRPEKHKPLDWEESAPDAVTEMEGVHDSERFAPSLLFLRWIFVLAFVFLVGRMFFLQIIRGPNFRAFSDNNRVRSQSLLAPRGLILDSQGKTLAQNTASFNLVAVPFDLPKNQADLQAETLKLTQVFSLDSQEILNKIAGAPKTSTQPLVLAQDISPENSILFQTRASEFLGFSVRQIPVRQYIDPEVFSHVLGYTGLVSQDNLAHLDQQKYDTVDYNGKLGVEAAYENYLHGSNGQDLVEVDATGKLLDVLGQNPPTPGDTLELNIDKDLQEKLYNDLKTGNGKRAAAVAINPKNGQVLALVSLPGFDNNLFAHGIKPNDYNALLADKSLPLFNRAIAGTYPPGSTVKPMVATAGLEEGVIDENTKIVDNGDLVVPNQFLAGQFYDFRGWKPGGLGAMTVRSAIALSSDIFFYEVAGGSPNGSLEGLGAQRLADFYRKFNLGSQTKIDISGEKPGLVPDPDWKMKFYHDDPLQGKWYLGDTYHIGIGQGDLLVTPLQVAEWTATIANNGTSYEPEVAKRAIDASGKVVWQNTPKVLVSNVASLKTLKIVQEGMRQTVTSGTAKPLNTLSITSAGKTGTSQFDGSNPNRTHAWFTAYAPYENPQIVITVLVEAGGEGNAVAEPVVKNALDWWAKNRYGK